MIANLIARADRITVKVGSSLLIEDSEDRIRREWLASLAADLAALRNEGKKLLVVSSGAVALGRRLLGLGRSTRLNQKQAAAAAGQPKLMQAWEEALAPHRMPTAQLLLTIEDSERRQRWLNARSTMETLLSAGALPIINENDSVATDELRYGDNDRLSARAAQMMRSDLLILLSDVDGLYTADPARDSSARHIPLVEEITADVLRYAGGANGQGVGTGGMRTKLAAARIAQASGCSTIIAAGHDPNPIARLIDGGRATLIVSRASPSTAYKQWIAGTLAPAGELRIDDGAAEALSAGKSLLPAGVVAALGNFERGDCLRVRDPNGAEIARGLTSYAAGEVQAILGCSSSAIVDRLGYNRSNELIHRDDLVQL
jgi:glutamate 5-kinase